MSADIEDVRKTRIAALRYISRKNTLTLLKPCLDIVYELIHLAATDGRYYVNFDWLPMEVMAQLRFDQFKVSVKEWEYKTGPNIVVRWD